MLELGVKPDAETFTQYIFPHSDLSTPEQLLVRMQSLGFTVREILTPLLADTLNKGNMENAEQLCT